MKKLLIIWLITILASSCSSNQESETLRTIQASFTETSDFSKEISQRYFNMIENQWQLNRQKTAYYYKRALKVDSFATVFYDYVDDIMVEHYQNKIDNTENHNFSYTDLLKKYRKTADSINKYSFYERYDEVKQMVSSLNLPKDAPNEKVFLYATLLQNDIAMGTTKGFISIYEQLPHYHCGFDEAVINIKEQAVSSDYSFSFTLESEYLAKQSTEKMFSRIDSVFYNNQPIKLSIETTPVFTFTKFSMDSLKEGHYIIYGGVKIYSSLGYARYYPFAHSFNIKE